MVSPFGVNVHATSHRRDRWLAVRAGLGMDKSERRRPQPAFSRLGGLAFVADDPCRGRRAFGLQVVLGRRNQARLCGRPAGGDALQRGPRLSQCRKVHQRHKELRRGRSSAPLYRIRAESADHVDLCQLSEGRLGHHGIDRHALSHALSRQSRRGLRPISHRPVLLPADPGRDPRPAGDQEGARRHGGGRHALSGIGICRRRPHQDRS